MEQDREVDQVLMNIKQNAGAAGYLILLSIKANMMLFTFLLRLVKKGLVPARFRDSYKEFLQKTEGNFTVYNIPVSESSAENAQRINTLELSLKQGTPGDKVQIEGEWEERWVLEKELKERKKLQKEIPEIEQLKRLDIEHCMLPKLNGSSRTIQVAIANTDEQRFKNWFLNTLFTRLSGGEKELEELKVLTEGNYSIFNLPFEGEELHAALPDFEILGINYTRLPDLKVGDGNSQIAIANTDKDKLAAWFQLWKDGQLAQGNEPGEMYSMDTSSYVATGGITQEEYVASADQQYQQANEEFEQNSVPLPWSEKQKGDTSEEYIRFLHNQNYERIGINKETLVDSLSVNAKFAEMRQKGFFLSRIPGTYGKTQEALILPSSQVFEDSTGKTYVAFLPKNGKILAGDADGNVYEKSFMEAYKPYSEVERNFRNVKAITEGEMPVQGEKQEKPKKQEGPVRGTRFNNFKDRDYDMAELEKKLLNL